METTTDNMYEIGDIWIHFFPILIDSQNYCSNNGKNIKNPCSDMNYIKPVMNCIDVKDVDVAFA